MVSLRPDSGSAEARLRSAPRLRLAFSFTSGGGN
jgi:hypothetical protein